MSKLERVNSLISGLGFELVRYNKATSSILRRTSIFEKYGINLIIDVGANTGIYGKEIRDTGYHGKIVSFEPLADAFKKLKENTVADSKWSIYNFALGAENMRQSINISANSHSSSILQISDAHTQAETRASYIGKQDIEIKTLDSIYDEIKGSAKEVFLKIDTQGFELNVLNGAINSLPFIHTIQLEMSLRPLYAGQPLYTDLMDFLHANDYKLIDIEPGFADIKTGTLLQFDGIFRKANFII